MQTQGPGPVWHTVLGMDTKLRTQNASLGRELQVNAGTLAGLACLTMHMSCRPCPEPQ